MERETEQIAITLWIEAKRGGPVYIYGSKDRDKILILAIYVDDDLIFTSEMKIIKI